MLAIIVQEVLWMPEYSRAKTKKVLYNYSVQVPRLDTSPGHTQANNIVHVAQSPPNFRQSSHFWSKTSGTIEWMSRRSRGAKVTLLSSILVLVGDSYQARYSTSPTVVTFLNPKQF
jgi:hypothetical protein